MHVIKQCTVLFKSCTAKSRLFFKYLCLILPVLAENIDHVRVTNEMNAVNTREMFCLMMHKVIHNELKQ